MMMTKRTDEGSAAAELVIVTPIFLAWLAAFLTGGEVLLARQQVNEAARAAVEAASTAATAPAAVVDARATVASELDHSVPACGSPVVTTEVRDFVPGGFVTVLVSCTVSVPGIPLVSGGSTTTVSAEAAAPIELYRVVGP
jgi:Flp pilus assembly protein TadG